MKILYEMKLWQFFWKVNILYLGTQKLQIEKMSSTTFMNSLN